MASVWKRFFVVLRRSDPVKIVFAGYFSYVLIGWILLCLPIAWQEKPIGALDNLFVATSAMSTTGLVTVDTGTAYSPFGQAVILLLIQFGGIGYMTLGSFVIIARRRKLSRFREQITHTTFTLPSDFDARRFVGQVVGFTIVVEALGVLALFFIFRDEHVPGALWQAIFHSVSSFCTAGFSLFNDSLERFRGDFWLNAVVGILSYLGAIGFIVQSDLYRKFTGRTRKITLTSKIILQATLWVSVIGWILLFLTEDAFRSMPAGERLMASWFQSMSAMTTVGFDTLPIGHLG
ncbi:MAG: hypothetical protein KC466_11815, partial [Myxococcales bacterium]|nr:hypothetical protein [Myxococcales bacterium]